MSNPFDHLFTNLDQFIARLFGTPQGESMQPDSCIVGPDELYAEFLRASKDGELKGLKADTALGVLNLSIQFTIAKQLSRIADALEAKSLSPEPRGKKNK